MPRNSMDQFVLNGQSFVYRDKHWTTPTGYRVSTSDGQRLTIAFYEKHGRVPGAIPVPATRRPAARREVAQPRSAR
jgi:hypothetical protein